jgi:hypothetical protein
VYIGATKVTYNKAVILLLRNLVLLAYLLPILDYIKVTKRVLRNYPGNSTTSIANLPNFNHRSYYLPSKYVDTTYPTARRNDQHISSQNPRSPESEGY